MSRRQTSEPKRVILTVEQLQRGIARLTRRLEEIEAFDPQTVQKRWGPEIKALETAIEETLASAYGHNTIEYNRYKAAVHLDIGPVLMRSDFPGVGRFDDRREAQESVAEGKKQSILLLRQAIRGLREELDEEETATPLIKDTMIRKILFLASNPTDQGRLRLDKEFREIAEGLKRSNERDQFNLIPNFAIRVDDLRRNLLDHSPRIVHFAGHDGTDGILVEDDQGLSFQVPNDALAGLFELCAGQIECVILNACYSALQADAIAKHIPYVIGMKAAVSDSAAIAFAVGFYDALGAGKSIEEAFGFGRNAVALKGIPEHLIPVLKKHLTTAENVAAQTVTDDQTSAAVANHVGQPLGGQGSSADDLIIVIDSMAHGLAI